MGVSSCRWMRTRLPLLAGDDLIGPDRRRAERHLIGCPACRRDLAALRAALEALRAVAEVPALAPSAVRPLWPDLARQIRESRRPAAFPGAALLANPTFALAATLLLTVTGALVSGFVRDRQAARPPLATRPAPPRPVPTLVAEPAEPDADESRDALVGVEGRDPSSRLAREFGGQHAVVPRPPTQDTN